MGWIDDYKNSASNVDNFISNIKSGEAFKGVTDTVSSVKEGGVSALIPDNLKLVIVAALVVVIMIK